MQHCIKKPTRFAQEHFRKPLSGNSWCCVYKYNNNNQKHHERLRAWADLRFCWVLAQSTYSTCCTQQYYILLHNVAWNKLYENIKIRTLHGALGTFHRQNGSIGSIQKLFGIELILHRLANLGWSPEKCAHEWSSVIKNDGKRADLVYFLASELIYLVNLQPPPAKLLFCGGKVAKRWTATFLWASDNVKAVGVKRKHRCVTSSCYAALRTKVITIPLLIGRNLRDHKRSESRLRGASSMFSP